MLIDLIPKTETKSQKRRVSILPFLTFSSILKIEEYSLFRESYIINKSHEEQMELLNLVFREIPDRYQFNYKIKLFDEFHSGRNNTFPYEVFKIRLLSNRLTEEEMVNDFELITNSQAFETIFAYEINTRRNDLFRRVRTLVKEYNSFGGSEQMLKEKRLIDQRVTKMQENPLYIAEEKYPFN